MLWSQSEVSFLSFSMFCQLANSLNLQKWLFGVFCTVEATGIVLGLKLARKGACDACKSTYQRTVELHVF